MKRSGGVTLAAVFSLLGSLATLLLGCLMLLAAVFARHSSTPTPGSGVMIFSSLMFFLPAAWGIATSIGLFRLKHWSRISILIFAGLLAFMGLSVPIAFFAMPMPPVPNQDPHIWTSVRVGMSALYLLLAAVGVWWLVFFNRASVKGQFLGGAPAAARSGRPISISIIAWLLLLGSLTTLGCALLRFPAVFFNRLLTGWAAVLCYLAFAVVTLYLGFGLLRLNPRARVLAIYYTVFAMLNAMLFYTLPGAKERLSAMTSSLPQFLRPATPTPVPTLNPWFLVVWIGVFMAGQIYFLVTRKAAFYRSHVTNEGVSPSESGLA
jgi:hypothetical protein